MQIYKNPASLLTVEQHCTSLCFAFIGLLFQSLLPLLISLHPNMHFFKIAAAFALASLVQGFAIPADTKEGVYAVSKRDDGTELHTRVAEATDYEPNDSALVSDNPADILKRGYRNQIWCGCGFNMNPGNCDAAVQDLKNQMGA
jgi:hypothetical protein